MTPPQSSYEVVCSVKFNDYIMYAPIAPSTRVDAVDGDTFDVEDGLIHESNDDSFYPHEERPFAIYGHNDNDDYPSSLKEEREGIPNDEFEDDGHVDIIMGLKIPSKVEEEHRIFRS